MAKKLSDAEFRNEVEKAARTLQVLRDGIERQLPRARSDGRIREIESELKWLDIVIEGLTHALRERKVQRWRATQLLLFGALSVKALSLAADVLSIEEHFSSAQVSIEQCIAVVNGAPQPPVEETQHVGGQSTPSGPVTNIVTTDKRNAERIVQENARFRRENQPAPPPEPRPEPVTVTAQVAELNLSGVQGRVSNPDPITGSINITEAPDTVEIKGTVGSVNASLDDATVETLGTADVADGAQARKTGGAASQSAVANPATIEITTNIPKPGIEF